MAGTFVETPSRALTIEHEPTGRALTQFKPEEARSDLSKVDVLAAYGVKLRDESKLRELAIAKLETVVDIVDWWERNVEEHGGQHAGKVSNGRIHVGEALTILGYSPKTNGLITKWRALARGAHADTEAAIDRIVFGWKTRAGMFLTEAKAKKETDDDRDLAVEMIFRAYTKLDPDQRIELKERIMAFEKSYKDPFAFKAA